MKVLHFADVHARDKDLPEIEECLIEIIQVAHDENPDLIVMAGDTFDSRMVRLDSLSSKLIFESYKHLADIAPMIVIVGTPSHDGMAPEVLEHIKADHEIYVAEIPEQILLTADNHFTVSPVIETPKAVISMVPAPTKQFWEQAGNGNQDIEEADQGIANALGVMMAGFGATAYDHDCPHIIAGHFTVGGAQVSETQVMTGREIEVSREQIGYANADLVALGHIHYAQKIDSNIFYSGSIYRKDWGELEDKGCFIHTLESGTLHSVFHETPSKKRMKVSADLTNGCRSLEDALSKYDHLELLDARVRFEIRVFQDEAGNIDTDSLIKQYPDLDIKIQQVPRESVRSSAILKVETLPDKIKAMAELRRETVPATILAKAEHLELMHADELLKMVVNG